MTYRKGSNHSSNPSEEDADKKKTKKKKSPVCYLHGPGHDMKSCKFMLVQAKSRNLTWLTTCDSGAGRVRFQGTRKRQAKGEELNSLVINAVIEVMKTNKRLKAKVANYSDSEED